jgi:sarcosine oxidase gamma subunit
MSNLSSPVARGPLVSWHRRQGATLDIRGGWEIAVRYPFQPSPAANRIIDLSHRATREVNGPQTGETLRSLCGAEVPLRRIHIASGWEAYRLTPGRAVLFGQAIPHATGPHATGLDVTGGWASLALHGPDRERILNKVTAVDLREVTLPVGSCCQGPIFGVNTLFGRFDNRFELHVCSDSAEFFLEVLLDAGREFELTPSGSG